MKPEKRKQIQDFILKYVQKIDPSGSNRDMYKHYFSIWTDKDIERLISSPIPIYAPNGGPVKLDHMRNIEIMKELGHDPETKCWITDPKTGIAALTRYKHLVLKLPIRRQTQMIDAKASIADHNRTLDKTTGQTTGASKGSSFSFPQLYVMFSKGYDATINELVNVRGGNVKLGKAVDRQIRETGSGTQNIPGAERTKVKSSVTLSAIFKAMHINNNLGSTK